MKLQVLGLSTPILTKELRLLEELVRKWRLRVEEEKIPAVDYVAPSGELLEWMRNFIGEMQLTSDKAASLATRILEGQDL